MCADLEDSIIHRLPLIHHGFWRMFKAVRSPAMVKIAWCYFHVGSRAVGNSTMAQAITTNLAGDLAASDVYAISGMAKGLPF